MTENYKPETPFVIEETGIGATIWSIVSSVSDDRATVFELGARENGKTYISAELDTPRPQTFRIKFNDDQTITLFIPTGKEDINLSCRVINPDSLEEPLKRVAARLKKSN